MTNTPERAATRIDEIDLDALRKLAAETDPHKSVQIWNRELRALLAAVRAPENEEVAHALVCLETIRGGSDFGKAFSADEIIGIITRLTARLSSAERDRDEARAAQNEAARQIAALRDVVIRGDADIATAESALAVALVERDRARTELAAANDELSCCQVELEQLENIEEEKIAAESALAVALVERDRAREALALAQDDAQSIAHQIVNTVRPAACRIAMGQNAFDHSPVCKTAAAYIRNALSPAPNATETNR